MSHFLNEPSQQIRNKICDYLQQNPTIMDMSASDIIFFESGHSLNDYIHSMRMPHVWGGAIEIAACVRIWNKTVIVRNDRTGAFIKFIGDEGENNDILKFRWTGGHYDPI